MSAGDSIMLGELVGKVTNARDRLQRCDRRGLLRLDRRSKRTGQDWDAGAGSDPGRRLSERQDGQHLTARAMSAPNRSALVPVFGLSSAAAKRTKQRIADQLAEIKPYQAYRARVEKRRQSNRLIIHVLVVGLAILVLAPFLWRSCAARVRRLIPYVVLPDQPIASKMPITARTLLVIDSLSYTLREFNRIPQKMVSGFR